MFQYEKGSSRWLLELGSCLARFGCAGIAPCCLSRRSLRVLVGTMSKAWPGYAAPATLDDSQPSQGSPPPTICRDSPGNPPLPLWLPSPINGLKGMASSKSTTDGSGAGRRKNGDSIVWSPPTALPPGATPTEAAAAASHAPAGAPSNGRGLQRKGPNPVPRSVSGGGGGVVWDSSVEMAS